MTRLRAALILLAIVIVVVVFGTVVGHGGSAKTTPTATPVPTLPATASPTAGAAESAAQPTASQTAIVVPTPAIALPQCPPAVVPAVDNPGRYGFCIPPGWGAYNDNNADTVTQLLRPHAGDTNPVLLPTDFARIQIVIALNTAAPTNLPADCTGAANDSIDGFPTHHCTAPLDASKNPYHANEAQFWHVELPSGKSFYITSQSANATQDDLSTINIIIHLVKPLGNR